MTEEHNKHVHRLLFAPPTLSRDDLYTKKILRNENDVS